MFLCPIVLQLTGACGVVEDCSTIWLNLWWATLLHCLINSWKSRYGSDFAARGLMSLFFHMQADNRGKLTSNARWQKVEPLVRSYLGNVLHFLSQLVENEMIRYARLFPHDNSETDVALFLLSLFSFVLLHLAPVIPYFEPFPKLTTKLLKALLRIWSTTEENTRIDAFLRYYLIAALVSCWFTSHLAFIVAFVSLSSLCLLHMAYWKQRSKVHTNMQTRSRRAPCIHCRNLLDICAQLQICFRAKFSCYHLHG